MDSKAKAAAVALARALGALGLVVAAAALEKHSDEVVAYTTNIVAMGAQTLSEAINKAIESENLGFPENAFKGRITGIVTSSFQNLASAAVTNAPSWISATVALARSVSEKLT